MNRVILLFCLFGTHQAGRVYDKIGICPTLSTMEGGYRQPMVMVKSDEK